MLVRIHFSRNKEKVGLPWSVLTSKGCHHASNVIVEPGCNVSTENKPNNKTNPRYFIKVRCRDLTQQGDEIRLLS